jgi:hypothetical protein
VICSLLVYLNTLKSGLAFSERIWDNFS